VGITRLEPLGGFAIHVVGDAATVRISSKQAASAAHANSRRQGSDCVPSIFQTADVILGFDAALTAPVI
jgi:hypothetical protein